MLASWQAELPKNTPEPSRAMHFDPSRFFFFVLFPCQAERIIVEPIPTPPKK
jgi:hypothetical protein